MLRRGKAPKEKGMFEDLNASSSRGKEKRSLRKQVVRGGN